ncbi:MAG: FkbM family methyltransferase [Dongiaceae bacterium]
MGLLGTSNNAGRTASSRHERGGLFGRYRGGNASAAEAAAPADGWADPHSIAFVDRYLKPGDHVLDIGANVGGFAIQAARCIGLEGSVDAFEPSPQMRMRLKEAIATARALQVVIHPRLVSGSNGLGRFLDGTGRFRRRRIVAPHELVSGGVIGVDQVMLDRWVDARSYALMKLDIAGCEMMALEGAADRLAFGNPPAILIALDAALVDFGSAPVLVAEWLAARGYETILYDADRHKLDYVAEPWQRRRMVLAVAQSARNDVSRRLADYKPAATNG